MNIAKLTALIPESFEWTYTDAEGSEQTETIALQLKRMSFGLSASKTFRKALDEQDNAAIADMLAGLIAEWDLDLNGEPFPPTAENIVELPVEFVAALAEKSFTRLFPNPPKAENSDGLSAQTTSSKSTMNSEKDTASALPASSGA